jgi:hypothetical protein
MARIHLLVLTVLMTTGLAATVSTALPNECRNPAECAVHGR